MMSHFKKVQKTGLNIKYMLKSGNYYQPKSHSYLTQETSSYNEFGLFLSLNNPVPGKEQFNLGVFSSKLSRFVDIVNNSKGINFTYSQYLASGADAAASASVSCISTAVICSKRGPLGLDVAAVVDLLVDPAKFFAFSFKAANKTASVTANNLASQSKSPKRPRQDEDSGPRDRKMLAGKTADKLAGWLAANKIRATRYINNKIRATENHNKIRATEQ